MLIIRLYLYGLMLLVPDYGGTSTSDSLTVLVADARHSPHGMDKHFPALFYCAGYVNEDCDLASAVLADGQPWENLEIVWLDSNGAEMPLSGGVVWNDEMNGGPGAGKQWPTEKTQEGADFDWTVKIREVLGTGFTVAARKECMWGDLSNCREAVASLRLEQGDVQTCKLVAFTDSGSQRVPTIEFVPQGKNSVRAASEMMYVELKASGVSGVRIKGSRGLAIDLQVNDARKCGSSGTDACFEIALVNAPLPSTGAQRGPGEHFRAYYDLLNITPTPASYPIPVISGVSGAKDAAKVQPVCFFDDFDHNAASRRAGKSSMLRMMIPEDRPICPIGTP